MSVHLLSETETFEMQPIFISILLGICLSPIYTLECYYYNERSGGISTTHGNAFCTAVFDLDVEVASFGGVSHSRAAKSKSNWSFSEGQDCQVDDTNDNQFYFCVCFENNCNFPLSITEFKERGRTLQAKL
ncbi:Activin_recp domain-containing protein [Caenorhabditis elegans]|uniref:Activin_recp domain-containing protein n=1 Tax=Caenorhabditis elegans TaxID=6239 RepID=Q20980_CAEEL|nr:Activin_recp domain-containing protein [Caenorhabditis elegans]CAA94774.1 Activin_recp domain-containing protein [Caenorhabditis elegans]|eukprot:NP_505514.1 Uncharacterized protein CELE_F58E6.4 [Caenorhabditis elegans]